MLVSFKKFENKEDVSILSYDFNMIDSGDNVASYEFKDDNLNNFVVEFSSVNDLEVEVKYFLRLEDGSLSYSKVSTNIWRLLKTIMVDIFLDFMDKNKHINSIKIVGLADGIETCFITKRTRIYHRFLENNPIEGWELDRYGNNIYLDKIEDES